MHTPLKLWVFTKCKLEAIITYQIYMDEYSPGDGYAVTHSLKEQAAQAVLELLQKPGSKKMARRNIKAAGGDPYLVDELSLDLADGVPRDDVFLNIVVGAMGIVGGIEIRRGADGRYVVVNEMEIS